MTLSNTIWRSLVKVLGKRGVWFASRTPNTLNTFTWRVFNRAISLTLMSLLALATPLAAQEPNQPSLKIIQVDTANFPQVSVTVVGENLPLESGQSIVVLEDGVEQPVDQNNRRFERVGAQIALILDASSSILQPGATGDPRYVEASYAVQRLVSGNFLAETDWLTSSVPAAGGEGSTLQAWTQDHGAVSNSFFNFKPDRSIGGTSLSTLINYALDNFPATSQPQSGTSLQHAIVIFSDGIVKGDTNLDTALQRAKQGNVRIHTVLVGAATPDGIAGMQGIAENTGGLPFQLSSLEDIDSFWQVIVPTSSQGVLSYRSQKANPRQVQIQLQLENGQTIEQTESIPPIAPPLQSAELQIQLMSPLEGSSLERKGSQPDTPLFELEPKELDVEVQVTWPDGRPRQLKSLTINLGAISETVSAPEETVQVNLPIADLGEGSYTLQAAAVDEFGLTSEASQSFKIVENRPPPEPTPLPPTPIPASVPTPPSSSPIESGWQIAVIIFGLIGLAALGVAFYTLRTVRKRVRGEAYSGATESKTEPYVIDKSQKFLQPNSKARLTLVDSSNSDLPRVIELYSGNTLIGRDPTLVNVVLKERRVSRYHCRVSEEGDETFRIWDEGSTSGTFVNLEQVGMSGQPLQDGDLINIGPVQYRFESEEGTKPSGKFGRKVPLPVHANPPTESTEPFEGDLAFEPGGTEPYEPDIGQDTEPEDPSWSRQDTSI